MKMHEFECPEVQRVMKDDLINGMDELGVLLLGHDANAWWYGSQLNIHAARELIGTGHNATILQVAAPLLGAIVWTIKNPNAGYCEPEDLPYREILEIANPYLGKLISVPSDWHPLKNRNILFPEKLNKENEWAFENFRVR